MSIRALVTRHTKHIFSAEQYIFTYALSGCTIFSTLSHKRHDFRKQCIEHKMCVLICCTTSVETFLILRRNKRDAIINVHKFSCKVLFFLLDFNVT